MPIAVWEASQCVLATTPKVPRISGRVVNGMGRRLGFGHARGHCWTTFRLVIMQQYRTGAATRRELACNLPFP
jgi:hypothetical protein